MPLVKPPVPDSTFDPFDGGVGVLTRDGEFIGNVATHLTWFLSPLSPFRKRWWVWYIVVWADGTRERSAEDYPPYDSVREMNSGHLEVVSADRTRSGDYDFAWLQTEDAVGTLHRLGITERDF